MSKVQPAHSDVWLTSRALVLESLAATFERDGSGAVEVDGQSYVSTETMREMAISMRSLRSREHQLAPQIEDPIIQNGLLATLLREAQRYVKYRLDYTECDARIVMRLYSDIDSALAGQVHEQGELNGFHLLREANQLRQEEWDIGSEKVNLSFLGNELAGETGELCNVIKKLERERLGIVGSRSTVEQAATELADVVICADLIARALGINTWDAVCHKFNHTSAKYGLNTRLSSALTSSGGAI
ncbi:MazG-like family protein [Aeromonas dhakensis]|uniref:MazG-like family protein n=1 Tax=Aeromonas dhakensis TaxID=196024 RepID=UPI003B9F4233